MQLYLIAVHWLLRWQDRCYRASRELCSSDLFIRQHFKSFYLCNLVCALLIIRYSSSLYFVLSHQLWDLGYSVSYPRGVLQGGSQTDFLQFFSSQDAFLESLWMKMTFLMCAFAVVTLNSATLDTTEYWIKSNEIVVKTSDMRLSEA